MNAERKKIQFEDILSLIGESGKWQLIIFLITWIEGILIGCHHLSSSFLGATMDHWCNTSHIPQLSHLNDWSMELKKQYAIPQSSQKYKQCVMYDLSSISYIPNNFEEAMKQRPLNLIEISCELPHIPDNEYFQYDDSEGLKTIVSDWNLVCSRLPLLSTVQGSYMGGVFIGCIVFGWASDKFGRRITMLIASLIQIVTTIATAFSPNYIIFIILRFLVAFSVSGVFECGFVLVTEICGPKYRTIFGILTQFPFGVGAASLPLIAYFIRDWYSLQLAISIPSLLLLIYYFVIPESPRWLLYEGRIDEAIAIIKNGARINQKRLPGDEELKEMLQHFQETVKEEESSKIKNESSLKNRLYDIFKELILLVETPVMRKRTLNVFFSWMVVAMVYYGLSFNSKNLGGNRYVSTFISGFVEIPAVVVIIPALARLGRVKCYSGTFIGGGISCALVAASTLILDTGDKIWIPVTFAMIGKFLISMTFAIAYLYTAELFPTPVRNVAVGSASTFARIGSMSAPYIVDLLGSLHSSIPVIIFGIVSFLAGIFSCALPETLNQVLPESIAEIEKSVTKKNNSTRTEEKDVEEEMINSNNVTL